MISSLTNKSPAVEEAPVEDAEAAVFRRRVVTAAAAVVVVTEAALLVGGNRLLSRSIRR